MDYSFITDNNITLYDENNKEINISQLVKVPNGTLINGLGIDQELKTYPITLRVWVEEAEPCYPMISYQSLSGSICANSMYMLEYIMLIPKHHILKPYTGDSNTKQAINTLILDLDQSSRRVKSYPIYHSAQSVSYYYKIRSKVINPPNISSNMYYTMIVRAKGLVEWLILVA